MGRDLNPFCGTADRHPKPWLLRSSQNLTLDLIPSQAAQIISLGLFSPPSTSSPLPGYPGPHPLPGRTRKGRLPEAGAGACASRSGTAGDAEGPEQGAEGPGRARTGCSSTQRRQAWRPGLSCSWAVGRSFLLHTCQWVFHCHRGPGNVPMKRHPPTPILLKTEDVPGAPSCSLEAASG